MVDVLVARLDVDHDARARVAQELDEANPLVCAPPANDELRLVPVDVATNSNLGGAGERSPDHRQELARGLVALG